MTRTVIRNLFVGIGAYWISWWVSIPLSLPFTLLTNRIHYYGFAGHLMMLVVIALPIAVAASAVGALTTWMVDAHWPARWALIPALLFFVHGFKGYHWFQPPTAIDRLEQVIQAAFPAIGCLVVGVIAERRLRPRAQVN